MKFNVNKCKWKKYVTIRIMMDLKFAISIQERGIGVIGGGVFLKCQLKVHYRKKKKKKKHIHC